MDDRFLNQLGSIQRALRRDALAGWLLVDSGHNRVAQLLLQSRGRPQRRYLFWIPAQGFPVALAHRLDSSIVERFPGEARSYDSWGDFRSQVGDLISSQMRVAVEYAPMGSQPFLDQVDGGAVELLRSYGAFLVSSGDLVSEFLGPLAPKELDDHRNGAQRLNEMAGKLTEGLRAHEVARDSPSTAAREWLEEDVDSQKLVLKRLNISELTSGDGTRCLHIDLAIRDGSCCAELARTVVIETQQIDPLADAYRVLNGSLEHLQAWFGRRLGQGRQVRAFEPDQVVRGFMAAAGVGTTMDHRLGHALGPEVPLGEVGLLDSYESYDTRVMYPRSVWSLQPSLLVGDIRVQTSASLIVGESDVEWTSLAPRELPSVT